MRKIIQFWSNRVNIRARLTRWYETPARKSREISNRINIRVRLTLWYLFSMGFILLLFSGYLRVRVESSLLDQVDTALELAAAQALGHVEKDAGCLVFQDTDALRRIDQKFNLYLIAPDGVVWDRLSNDDAPIPKSLKTGYTTIEKRGFDRDDWRIYNQQVSLPDGAAAGWLQVAQSLDDNEATLESLMDQMGLVLPLVFILAGVGGFFLASRTLRPIDDITRTAQVITTSDLEGRINYTGANDEVGRLAMTFDSMLDRLQDGFERERRFAADAAHELRTPLTALKGRIGVTLSQPRQSAEYQDALCDMEGQVDRLIRLSHDLLFLVRLDHKGWGERSDEIVLGDLLAALVEQVNPLVKAKTITLVESIPPDLTVNGDMDLLIRLFLNLFDNAIKYTPPGGQIRVKARQRADHVNIRISDTGPGIPLEQLPHLFERFYRAESDRARRHGQVDRAPGGAGLGLAIAREIAQAHGGTLTVQSRVGQGSTFTFRMPVSP